MTVKFLFFAVLCIIALAGAFINGLDLFRNFYFRPLVRFAGYASLLVYSLLMLHRARYNTRL